MIKKLQRRLTAFLMLFLVSVYAVSCAISYFAGQNRMERESAGLFDRIGEHEPPADGPQRMPGQVGVPFFTVRLDPDGTVRHVEQGQFEWTEEELTDIVRTVMEMTADEGYLEKYGIRFRRHTSPMGTELMFLDESVRGQLQDQQLSSNVILGLMLLPVFYLFSWGVSILIVRPVKRAWEQQRQFVADASHELKTPLTVILSNTDLILADCGEENTELRRRADYVRQEAGRMRTLVRDLLHLARNDAAPTKREDLTAVDLSAAVENAVLSFEAVAYERGMSIRVAAEEGIIACGDAQQLARLANILLDNAVKYSLTGGEIVVKLSAERGKWAVLTVENPSEPLTQDQLARLFDRFYRVDEARSGSPGYGLGLSVARQIAERCGGMIRAEHRDDMTRIIVKLPMK